ncbi:hypothetical protein Cgig2_030687 [Carnegiea gigantea]|uniref:Pentatricopeptide repeat-containing protein n=1 Tax=Carnegiea gigantea TaxID=171969 RepID=A0A9Q1GSI9_9CARY|nr:hypothetical protein Cgig2_030687 [Carnegiea gigantea]
MKHYDIAISLLRGVQLLGIPHDVYSLAVLINCHCQLNHVSFGMSVLGKLFKLGYSLNCIIFTTLINGSINVDELDQALYLLERILKQGFQPSLVTYGALEMLSTGVTPDIVTYNTLIDGLCKDSRLHKALHLFGEIQAQELSPDVVSCASLLDGLCKNGKVNDAVAIFTELDLKELIGNIVVYSILIDGMCEEGRLKDAANIFSKLLSKGLQPNCKTYRPKWRSTDFVQMRLHTIPLLEDFCATMKSLKLCILLMPWLAERDDRGDKQ